MKVSKNFSRYEFECQCGCGFAAADVTLLEALEDADRKSTRLNSSHSQQSRMPSSA